MTSRKLLIAFALAAVASCNHEEAPTDAPVPVEPAPTTVAPAPAPVPTPAAPVLPVRRVVEASGTVKLNGQPITAGAELPATGSLETGKDGQALITLGPGSVIELRKSSKVTLGTSEKKKDSLKLLVGTLWSFLPTGSSYEVATDNAVAGVRGTIFYMEAKKGETYICACDGDVEETATGQLPRNVVSDHAHIGTVVKGKGKKVKVLPGKLRGHTDAQAAELLAKQKALTP